MNGFGFQNEKKKKGPVSYGWFGLGQGRGIKWTLWPNSVAFARQEKQGDKWLTTEELHVAPSVLKEIAWRAGHWLASIEKNSRRSSRKNYGTKSAKDSTANVSVNTTQEVI